MPEAMRLSNSPMQEETDDGGEAMRRGNSSEACLSLVSTGVGERERENIGQRERACVAIDGRMGVRFRYSFIFTGSYCS